MNDTPNQPAAIIRPARNEVRLRAQQIKRPPAKRLAEALLEQFPDIDIALRDEGWTAAAILNGQAVLLCEQYKHERDLREGWWTLMDEVFPQLAQYFAQYENPPVANEEAPQIIVPPTAKSLEPEVEPAEKPTAEVISLVERQRERAHP